MNITKEIGTRIRKYRKSQKLTQENLSALCGLHPTYIGQIERAEKNASIESIYKICTALGLPFDVLFENVEENLNDEPENIPLKAYNLLETVSKDQQALLYRILENAYSLIDSE